MATHSFLSVRRTRSMRLYMKNSILFSSATSLRLLASSGKINMASGGNGSSVHLSGELFKMMAGVDMLHVPYRGIAPALTDLLGGQVQVMFATITASIEYIRGGNLRALAVTTATR